MNFWEKLAEERIQLAAREGAFENLPGLGQPLALEDDSHIDPELRLAYKALSMAGYVPPEVELMREINHTHDLLRSAPDENTRYRAIERLNYLQMKLGSLRPGTPLLENQHYAARLVENLSSK